jgi:hypothetical protein
VFFLAGGIPEGELNVLVVDLDVGDIVFEHGGDIMLPGVSLRFTVVGAKKMTSEKMPLAKTVKREV